MDLEKSQKAQNLCPQSPSQKTNGNAHGEFFLGLRIYAFFGTMLLLFLVGLLLFLRPTVSESEKRELTKFPAFSWETLVSGEYFDQINTW